MPIADTSVSSLSIFANRRAQRGHRLDDRRRPSWLQFFDARMCSTSMRRLGWRALVQVCSSLAHSIKAVSVGDRERHLHPRGDEAFIVNAGGDLAKHPIEFLI